MGEKYKDYTDLSNRLKEYSRVRSGEIAELTGKAADVIDTLVQKVKDMEAQEDDLK